MRLLNNDDSWDEIQFKLRAQLNTHPLSDCLDELYHQQINTQFINPDIINNLNNNVTVHQQPNDPNSPFLIIQYNPHRSNRGTPDKNRTHHTAQHHIAFKGGMPCFCCRETIQVQWPNERGFTHNIAHHQLLFLPNISPIFPHHFTIATVDHIAQYIDIASMLKLASELPEYWIIQNGAGAGATNPEHFHFQCFKCDPLPITTFPATTIEKTADFHHENVSHPANVSKWTFASNNKKAKSTLITHVTEYEKQSDTHRVNIILIEKNGEHTCFVVYRDTTRKTPLYKTGQPGYAEAAGIISTITDDRFENWKSNAWEMYESLLSAI